MRFTKLHVESPGYSSRILLLSQKRITRFREHFSLPDLLPFLELFSIIAATDHDLDFALAAVGQIEDVVNAYALKCG
jgi:hypothetical protein